MKQGIKDHSSMPKPKTDDGYFEMMSRAVFAAGLNWRVIDNKWLGINSAFDNFSVEKVAKYDPHDIEKLIQDKRVVRNYKKLNAIVDNARAILNLQKEFGSFPKYLASFKEDDEKNLVKDLGKRFSFLGPSTAVIFLYGCGEKTSHPAW
jgi:3-methyladenine DNA glycosylase